MHYLKSAHISDYSVNGKGIGVILNVNRIARNNTTDVEQEQYEN